MSITTILTTFPILYHSPKHLSSPTMLCCCHCPKCPQQWAHSPGPKECLGGKDQVLWPCTLGLASSTPSRTDNCWGHFAAFLLSPAISFSLTISNNVIVSEITSLLLYPTEISQLVQKFRTQECMQHSCTSLFLPKTFREIHTFQMSTKM